MNITPETLLDAALAAAVRADEEKRQRAAALLLREQEEERTRRRAAAALLAELLEKRLGLTVIPADEFYVVGDVVFTHHVSRDGSTPQAYRRTEAGHLKSRFIYSLADLGELLMDKDTYTESRFRQLETRFVLPEDAGQTWPTDLPPTTKAIGLEEEE